MNDLSGLLSSDYVFKPSGKSPPMAPSNPNSNTHFPNLANFDDFFSNSNSNSAINSNTNDNAGNVEFDSIFGPSKASSLPVFDKPVYDDDDDDGGDVFEDVLGARTTGKGGGKAGSGFDDLLPGFGGGGSSINRSSSDTAKKSSSVLDDPFVVLKSTSHHESANSGVLSDPLEEIGNLNNLGSKNLENVASGGVFDDIDPLNDFAHSVPFSAEMNGREKDEIPARKGSGREPSPNAERGHYSSVTSPERDSERKGPLEDFEESLHNVFEMPSVPAASNKPAKNVSPSVYNDAIFRSSYSHSHVSPLPEENMGSSDEVWLTVSEIPLFTQPTAAPPPSRPPPPRSGQFSSNEQSKVNEYPSFHASNPYFQSPKSVDTGATGSFPTPFDELEEFAAGRNQNNMDEDFDTNSVAAASAAAMKEAMDRAEAKFRYARGVRERENIKASRSREPLSVEKEEKAFPDDQDREFREGQVRLMRERQQRERDREEGEEEKRRREEEDRRRMEKEQEEKEREKRRVERERELARQAVERATREARERAAIEARTRAERAAVQKANSEARARAEKAAVQRAHAEARERAAASAKERAEKTAEEAREKARSEAREKEARERTSDASTASQHNNAPDIDSIFGVNSRASSASRPRATSSDSFETQFQSKAAPEATRPSVNPASSMRKASSSTSIVNDLTSIFGEVPSSSGVFQDIDGETDDRRRARIEREQRIKERSKKAVDEKNARELEAQREQDERHRISGTLDVEIKRWAAGKEGNLRALLSTLQYVLWPECGWQPVSLTDLITGASVKKVYRKATLCIHPDKVQQKGANIQQKYVAEKVFDLLKEAWNKFNSEELF